jgi:hypothetical protein
MFTQNYLFSVGLTLHLFFHLFSSFIPGLTLHLFPSQSPVMTGYFSTLKPSLKTENGA